MEERKERREEDDDEEDRVSFVFFVAQARRLAGAQFGQFCVPANAGANAIPQEASHGSRCTVASLDDSFRAADHILVCARLRLSRVNLGSKIVCHARCHMRVGNNMAIQRNASNVHTAQSV